MPADFEERINAHGTGGDGRGGTKGQKQEEVSFFRKYVSAPAVTAVAVSVACLFLDL